MTLNECMCIISEWYKKASTYKKSNAFKSAYLMEIRKLNDLLINTSLCSDSNFLYIDQRLLSMQLDEILPFDDDSEIGEKQAKNDLYHITNKWRVAYRAGKLY